VGPKGAARHGCCCRSGAFGNRAAVGSVVGARVGRVGNLIAIAMSGSVACGCRCTVSLDAAAAAAFLTILFPDICSKTSGVGCSCYNWPTGRPSTSSIRLRPSQPRLGTIIAFLRHVPVTVIWVMSWHHRFYLSCQSRPEARWRRRGVAEDGEA
jgi:hypothetical protein